MKYSKKKIAGFDRNKKRKILRDYLLKIEEEWPDVASRRDNLAGLGQFAKDIGDDGDFVAVVSDIVRLVDHAELHEDRADVRTYQGIAIPILRKLGHEPKDMDITIAKGDGSGEARQIPLLGIVNNLRSAFNVGALIRVAECVGIEKLYLCGYTATPENAKVSKTSMETAGHVAWEYREDAKALIRELQSLGIPVIALETVQQAPSIHEFDFPRPCAILVGNEALGIEEDLLKMVDRIVQIPVNGWKNSLNVATSFAVTCYEALRQWDYKDNRYDGS